MIKMMQKGIAVFTAVILLTGLAGCSEIKKIEKDIKNKAELIIPFEYDSIEFFGDELYAVKKEGGKFGIIDVNGNVVVEPVYDSFEPVTVGDKVYYFAKIGNGGSGATEVLLDENGKQVDASNTSGAVSDLYAEYESSSDPMRNIWGYKSRKTGEWVISPRFDMASDFHDGIAVVGVSSLVTFDGMNGMGGIEMTETKHGYMKENGDFLLDVGYSKLVDFNSNRGVLPVTIESKSKINLDLPLASWLTGVNTNNADSVSKNTFFVFIDSDGYVVNDKLWYDTLGYDNGFAYVQETRNGTWSVIDIDGNIVKDNVCASVRRLDYGTYEVKEDKNSNAVGLADNMGNYIVKPSRIFNNIKLHSVIESGELKKLDNDLYLFEESFNKFYIINNNEINSQTSISDLKSIDGWVLGYIDGKYAISENSTYLVFKNESGSEVLRIRCGSVKGMRNDQFIVSSDEKAAVIRPVFDKK